MIVSYLGLPLRENLGVNINNNRFLAIPLYVLRMPAAGNCLCRHKTRGGHSQESGQMAGPAHFMPAKPCPETIHESAQPTDLLSFQGRLLLTLEQSHLPYTVSLRLRNWLRMGLVGTATCSSRILVDWIIGLGSHLFIHT